MNRSEPKTQNLCGFELMASPVSRPDLKVCADSANKYHAKAAEHWQHALRYAKMAGQALLQAKRRLPHGRWGPWLRQNFKGSETNAQNYMRIAERWEEIEHETNRSINKALHGLRSRKGSSGKKFDPDDLLRSQAFKIFLRDACKDWTAEELAQLKEGIVGWDIDFQEFLVETMKSVLNELRRINAAATSTPDAKVQEEVVLRSRIRRNRRNGRRGTNRFEERACQP